MEERQVKRAALNREEAALLPAMAGNGALMGYLRNVRKAADAMAGKKPGEWVKLDPEKENKEAISLKHNLAALHHVLRK